MSHTQMLLQLAFLRIIIFDQNPQMAVGAAGQVLALARGPKRRPALAPSQLLQLVESLALGQAFMENNVVQV